MKVLVLIILISHLSLADESKNLSIVQLASGDNFTCALFDSGRAKCWGMNLSGQLGYGDINSRGKKADTVGKNLPFIDFGTDLFLEELSTGQAHVCARVRGKNAPICWGANEKHQLGHGAGNNVGSGKDQMNKLSEVPLKDVSPVIRLTSGDYFTCGLHDSGKVECWGANWNGEGRNSPENEFDYDPTPPPEVNAHDLVNFGKDSKAVEIVGGSDFVCARFAAGNVRCIGVNFAGQLGVGDTTARKSNEGNDVMLGGPAEFLVAGSFHACAGLKGGNFKCWGRNDNGQLGQGDRRARGMLTNDMAELMPIDLGMKARVVAAAASYRKTCAVLSNRAVKCWGITNPFPNETIDVGAKPGDMGDNLDFTDFGRLARVQELVMGLGHSCARLSGAKIRCIGNNAEGQLGNASETSRTYSETIAEEISPVLLF